MTELEKRRQAARFIRELLPKMPFNSMLQMRFVRAHADGVTIECPVRDFMMNGASVVHGGVAATLVDAAAGLSTNYLMGGLKRITTVELKINYFKPVSSGKIQARGRVLRLGSTLSVSHVEVFNGARNMVGTAIVTYMILGDR
ncbi:MAG: PaaI family thioesterase [Bryobacteraceae bacterium]|nr:PaaI family thioesterase [Bryobacteraceae bacterium]